MLRANYGISAVDIELWEACRFDYAIGQSLRERSTREAASAGQIPLTKISKQISLSYWRDGNNEALHY